MYALKKRKTVTSGEYKTCRKCHRTMHASNFVYHWDFTHRCIDCINLQARQARRTEQYRIKNKKYKNTRYKEDSTFRETVLKQKRDYRQRIKQQTPPWTDIKAINQLKREVTKLNELDKVLCILKGEEQTKYCIQHIIPLIAMDLVNGQWMQVASGLHTNSNIIISTKNYAAQRWNRLENNND